MGIVDPARMAAIIRSTARSIAMIAHVLLGAAVRLLSSSGERKKERERNEREDGRSFRVPFRLRFSRSFRRYFQLLGEAEEKW